MLQYLTFNSDRYSVAEQAQMMIEAGCRWIEVTGAETSHTLRETIDSLTEICKENECFLMVDSDVELSNEMRIHGVYLRKGDMAPAAARELLGPHAVIGVEVREAADIQALRGLDIDYVALELDRYADIEAQKAAIGALSEAAQGLPVVARGEIDAALAPEFIAAGAAGIATGKALFDGTESAIVDTCHNLIETLYGNR